MRRREGRKESISCFCNSLLLRMVLGGLTDWFGCHSVLVLCCAVVGCRERGSAVQRDGDQDCNDLDKCLAGLAAHPLVSSEETCGGQGGGCQVSDR